MPSVRITARADNGETRPALFNVENYDFVTTHPQNEDVRRIIMVSGNTLDIAETVDQVDALIEKAEKKSNG